jgi:signal transduction histidine kinase
MRLQAKAFTVMLVLTASLAVALHLVSSRMMMREVRRSERERITRDLDGVQVALKAQARRLGATAGDWAFWDESYDFVRGAFPEFPAENMTTRTLVTLELQVMMFLSPQGQPLTALSVNAEGLETPLSPALLAFATRPLAEWGMDPESKLRSGLAVIDGESWVFAACEVLPATGIGEPVGVLLVGHRVNGQELAQAMKLIVVQVNGLDETETGPAAGEASDRLDALNAQVMEGRRVLMDAWDRPALRLWVQNDRETYRNAQATQSAMSWALAALTMGGGVFYLVLMRQVVVRPVESLREQVRKVRSQGDLNQRMVMPGRDELRGLSDDINDLLSNLQQAQARLEKARAAAAAASAAKSQFLANVSHELRTPLAAVLGFTELVLMESLPMSALESLESVWRNGQRLLGIVDDMLDLASLETGQVAVELVECSPTRILADVASEQSDKALEKDLGFELVYVTAVPCRILTDPRRLGRVLRHLLDNAVKFTRSGKVRIEVSTDAAPQSAATWLRIAVSDTGVGMSDEVISRLFRPFEQADNSLTREFGGAGLGLAVAARAAALLGGRIDVRSTVGAGSTFTLEVPLNQASVQSEQPAESFEPTSVTR